jgi:hypothetical protein
LAVDKEEFQGTDQMPMHSFPSTCSVSLVVVLVPSGFWRFWFLPRAGGKCWDNDCNNFVLRIDVDFAGKIIMSLKMEDPN